MASEGDVAVVFEDVDAADLVFAQTGNAGECAEQIAGAQLVAASGENAQRLHRRLQRLAGDRCKFSEFAPTHRGALPVFDQLDPLALTRRAQAQCQPNLLAATGATDAVDMDFSVLGDIDVNDGADGADVEAARGDIGGHQHRATAVGELHQQFVALTLFKFAVQGQR